MNRRAVWTAIAGIAVILMLTPPIIGVAPLLLWNATASVPMGLYLLCAPGAPHVGDLIVVRPPAPVARLLAARGLLPLGVPLIKPLAAVGGQTICRRSELVSIDSIVKARVLGRDRRGRRLPSWAGCRVLAPGEIFVLNGAEPDSFDGRYFGPLPITTLIGRAKPLWTTSGS